MLDNLVKTDPVPAYLRGVWQRRLLRVPSQPDDTATTVFWVQAARWHGDIRIPTGRPDFKGLDSLNQCNDAQLAWLKTQQGFAGVTTFDPATRATQWHRQIDFQPPALWPDAGYAKFEDEVLVETGIHTDYMEHWHHVPGSGYGCAVFRCLDRRVQSLMLVAGSQVLLLRSRDLAFDLEGWSKGDRLRAQLDFEISHGVRNKSGWQILHSTLPWREMKQVSIFMNEQSDGSVVMNIDGVSSRWEVLEWSPPK